MFKTQKLTFFLIILALFILAPLESFAFGPIWCSLDPPPDESEVFRILYSCPRGAAITAVEGITCFDASLAGMCSSELNIREWIDDEEKNDLYGGNWYLDPLSGCVPIGCDSIEEDEFGRPIPRGGCKVIWGDKNDASCQQIGGCCYSELGPPNEEGNHLIGFGSRAWCESMAIGQPNVFFDPKCKGKGPFIEIGPNEPNIPSEPTPLLTFYNSNFGQYLNRTVFQAKIFTVFENKAVARTFILVSLLVVIGLVFLLRKSIKTRQSK